MKFRNTIILVDLEVLRTLWIGFVLISSVLKIPVGRDAAITYMIEPMQELNSQVKTLSKDAS